MYELIPFVHERSHIDFFLEYIIFRSEKGLKGPCECGICGLKTNNAFNIRSHIQNEHFSLVYIKMEWVVKRHNIKPWKDPESLFCDGDFLTNDMGLSIADGDECEENINDMWVL